MRFIDVRTAEMREALMTSMRRLVRIDTPSPHIVTPLGVFVRDNEVQLALEHFPGGPGPPASCAHTRMGAHTEAQSKLTRARLRTRSATATCTPSASSTHASCTR